MNNDTDGFCDDPKPFGALNKWRIERRTFVRSDNGNTMTTEALVPPNFHVRLDKGMKYRFATPKPVKGTFDIFHNGYCLNIMDEDYRVAASIRLPEPDESTNKGGYTREECIWIAQKIANCLNTMDNAEFFQKGQIVNVEQRDGDLFNHDFTGTVKGFRNELIIVEDQDGDCWEVEPDQISFNSDEHMH